MKLLRVPLPVLVSSAVARPINDIGNSGFERLAALSSELDKHQTGGSSDTRNALVNGICRPITVIYTRGTSEARNVFCMAGPPFFDALDTQGVDHSASVQGTISGGDAAGSAKSFIGPASCYSMPEYSDCLVWP